MPTGFSGALPSVHWRLQTTATIKINLPEAMLRHQGWRVEDGGRAASAQVNDFMTNSGVQVDMAAELVDRLAGGRGRMCMEAALRALLHQLQAPGGGQAEEATALARVARRHHYRDGLLQHCLHT